MENATAGKMPNISIFSSMNIDANEALEHVLLCQVHNPLGCLAGWLPRKQANSLAGWWIDWLTYQCTVCMGW